MLLKNAKEWCLPIKFVLIQFKALLELISKNATFVIAPICPYITKEKRGNFVRD